MDLAIKFESRAMVAVAMFTVVIATLAVNIAANVVSPANDFANALPRWITFRRGGLITGLIGVAMCPWKLLADPSGYIFQWLLGYSGGLGSIAGVLVADYWFVKKKELDLADLYRADGRYAYGEAAAKKEEDDGAKRATFAGSGTNMIAVAATLLGCLFAWIGVVLEPLRPLFDYAWFVGAGVAAAVYIAGMKLTGDRAAAR
jgi:NCS1 family nucleobase:cation symporter-1